MQFTKNKAAVLLGAGAIAVAGSGIAFASFGASGVSSGSSNGHSVAKADLGVSVTAPAGLYPTEGVGADTTAPGNIVATVTNSNPYNVTLTSASVTAVSSTTSGCTPALSDFAFGTPSYSNSGVVTGTAKTAAHAAGTGTATIAITSVANTLSDSCANADLSFTVSVGGASS